MLTKSGCSCAARTSSSVAACQSKSGSAACGSVEAQRLGRLDQQREAVRRDRVGVEPRLPRDRVERIREEEAAGGRERPRRHRHLVAVDHAHARAEVVEDLPQRSRAQERPIDGASRDQAALGELVGGLDEEGPMHGKDAGAGHAGQPGAIEVEHLVLARRLAGEDGRPDRRRVVAGKRPQRPPGALLHEPSERRQSRRARPAVAGRASRRRPSRPGPRACRRDPARAADERSSGRGRRRRAGERRPARRPTLSATRGRQRRERHAPQRAARGDATPANRASGPDSSDTAAATTRPATASTAIMPAAVARRSRERRLVVGAPVDDERDEEADVEEGEAPRQTGGERSPLDRSRLCYDRARSLGERARRARWHAAAASPHNRAKKPQIASASRTPSRRLCST